MSSGLWVLVAYILGSLPSAVWISKIFFKQDIRNFGSKNSGLTNTIRVYGWKAGVPVAILDLGKGILATWLGLHFAPYPWNPTHFALICGLVAILGHSFTCFAGFRGGKGVLTGMGVYLVLSPLGALLSFAVFGLTLKISGYASLGSILGALYLSIHILVEFLRGIQNSFVLYLTLFVTAFVIFRHRTNIVRLLNGTESKIGQKKSATPMHLG